MSKRRDKELTELGVQVSVVVYRRDGQPLDQDVVADEFIAIAEQHGWYIGGTFSKVDLHDGGDEPITLAITAVRDDDTVTGHQVMGGADGG